MCVRVRAVARAQALRGYGGYGGYSRYGESVTECECASVRVFARGSKMHLSAAAGPTRTDNLTTSRFAGPPFAIFLLSRLHQHSDEHDPAHHARSRQLRQHLQTGVTIHILTCLQGGTLWRTDFGPAAVGAWVLTRVPTLDSCGCVSNIAGRHGGECECASCTDLRPLTIFARAKER